MSSSLSLSGRNGSSHDKTGIPPRASSFADRLGAQLQDPSPYTHNTPLEFAAYLQRKLNAGGEIKNLSSEMSAFGSEVYNRIHSMDPSASTSKLLELHTSLEAELKNFGEALGFIFKPSVSGKLFPELDTIFNPPFPDTSTQIPKATTLDWAALENTPTLPYNVAAWREDTKAATAPRYNITLEEEMAWEEAALELVRAMRFVSPHTVGLANELLNPKTYSCEKLVETANNLLRCLQRKYVGIGPGAGTIFSDYIDGEIKAKFDEEFENLKAYLKSSKSGCLRLNKPSFMDRVVSDPDIYRAYSAANSKIHKNVRFQSQEAAQPVDAKATGVTDSLGPFLVGQAEACNKDQGYTPPPKKKRKAST